jgi:hypothetical protein
LVALKILRRKVQQSVHEERESWVATDGQFFHCPVALAFPSRHTLAASSRARLAELYCEKMMQLGVRLFGSGTIVF